MFKYSKLKRSQINRLIDCFLLGLPALQTAKYTGLHRNTINRFFKRIRIKIANHLRKENETLKGEIELDETYFGGRKKGKRGRGSTNKRIVVGILERGGKVKTIIVDNVKAETLMKKIVKNTEKGCVYYTDKFRLYNSLSRYGKHFKIDHTKEFRKEKHNHINGIEGFWSYAKKFLIKYNGISKKNFYLYLKEIEWRFNNRKERDVSPTSKSTIQLSPTSKVARSDSSEVKKVIRVIDGDTIVLENGKTVRYIGIDTPELHHPKKKVECFAKEAKVENEKLVLGKMVRLEKDVSETDKYGRLRSFSKSLKERARKQ